jgi:hypothetical protein
MPCFIHFICISCATLEIYTATYFRQSIERSALSQAVVQHDREAEESEEALLARALALSLKPAVQGSGDQLQIQVLVVSLLSSFHVLFSFYYTKF